MALACPVHGNRLDAATLALVDTDLDGRIRAPELLAAVAWLDANLVDLGAALAAVDGLAIDNLADETMRASARRILEGHGTPNASVITVADTTAANRLLDAMPANGDGVLPPTAVEGEARAAIVDLLATVGGVPDRTGAAGADEASLVRFFEALEAYAAWHRRAAEDEDTVVPLGPATASAVAAFVAVRDKVEDYFTRCALAAFDPRAAAPLAGRAELWAAMAQRDLDASDPEIRSFPLAEIAVGQALKLPSDGAGLNPAWAAAMARFRAEAVVPLLGDLDTLTHDAWRDLCSRFAAYEAWLAAKEGAVVEPLGIERITALLGSGVRAELEAALAADVAVRPEAEALGAVERAARYHRDLIELVRNFVTFSYFYDTRATAMFQVGKLYLDGRSCDLVVEVVDVDKHASLAAGSYLYLAYCVCTRKGAAAPRYIAAAFTDGDDDFLSVGRNGVLYDRDGKDWDATIVKVVEQPISIRQAFFTPYKRLGRFVSEQVEKYVAEQDQASQARLGDAASGTLAGATGKSTEATPSSQVFDVGRYAGIFAAIGLGMGFLVSALTMLLTAFLTLRPWQMPLAILALLLLISGPSMLLAAFKLSRRNLAPVLDANGWAINARARINLSFGHTLTQLAALPSGSASDLTDPFRDRRPPWVLLGLLVAVLMVVGLVWDFGVGDWVQTWAPTLLPTPEVPAVPMPEP